MNLLVEGFDSEFKEERKKYYDKDAMGKINQINSQTDKQVEQYPKRRTFKSVGTTQAEKTRRQGNQAIQT